MSSLSKAQKILSPVLTPASFAYRAFMSRRAGQYASGGREQFSPSCPCISIGNIGSGGSGKTPLSDWMLKWAKEQGMSAVLLTRGYGATPPGLPYLVNFESLAAEAGDEPLMLALQNPQARIVVDPVRKRSGAWVTDKFSPDLMLLDDGFQHMAVKRDLDFVLLTPDDLEDGWNKVIPRGTWREGVDALMRGDVFFVKGSPSYFNSVRGLIKERLGRFRKPVFQFGLKAAGLLPLAGGERQEFGTDKYLLFAGIGNPNMLRSDAEKYMGQEPADFIIFKDHHSYTGRDVEHIRSRAQKCGAIKVICTPKDAVKLMALGCEDFYMIDLELEFKESVFFDGSEECNFVNWWNAGRYGSK